jgi:excisionase family DNA binding protein
MILLTTKQAADILGIPPRTLNRWVVAGKIAPTAQGPGPKGARLFDALAVGALKESALTLVTYASRKDTK